MRRHLPWRTAALTTLLALTCCAAAPLQPHAGLTPMVPPVNVAGARAAPAPLPARLSLPPGAGPHPVVIVLHGCGGVGTNQMRWAERLNQWGYGALVIDSLTPRGQRTVCPAALQPLVTRFDRAGDVIAAARWLQGQPGVDGARIAVLGGSHGGATAATVANRHFEAEAHGLIRASVDYYGACREPGDHGKMPLLAMAGEDDTWGWPARECQAFQQAVGAAEDVTVRTWPGVVHGFENPATGQRVYSEGHPLQYDPGAAEESFRLTHAFLDRTIGDRAVGPGTKQR